MKKTELTAAVDACVEATRQALQTLWDSINQGQRKQLLKRPDIAQLLSRYGVETE